MQLKPTEQLPKSRRASSKYRDVLDEFIAANVQYAEVVMDDASKRLSQIESLRNAIRYNHYESLVAVRQRGFDAYLERLGEKEAPCTR
jgi:hypothetical protein